MLYKQSPEHGKFKFCFLKLSVSFFFFFNIFTPWLVESTDTERMDTEGQLYYL